MKYNLSLIINEETLYAVLDCGAALSHSCKLEISSNAIVTVSGILV